MFFIVGAVMLSAASGVSARSTSWGKSLKSAAQAAGNFQTALDLANYVKTTLNSKSIDAKKIMADAKAALLKIGQEKMAEPQQKAVVVGQSTQGQAEATQTVSDVKNFLGRQK